MPFTYLCHNGLEDPLRELAGHPHMDSFEQELHEDTLTMKMQTKHCFYVTSLPSTTETD